MPARPGPVARAMMPALLKAFFVRSSVFSFENAVDCAMSFAPSSPY